MNKKPYDPPPPAQGTYLLPGGGVARFDGGDWMFTGMDITAVSIANLSEVEHHIIAHIADSTAHHVRFHGSGELHYVFNARGEIVDLWAANHPHTEAPDDLRGAAHGNGLITL